MIDRYKNWKLGEFIEEMILICEIVEVPGMKQRLSEIKTVIKERFTEEEREAAGLVF
jgi:hypothetical protein